jgi:hypothetical protein
VELKTRILLIKLYQLSLAIELKKIKDLENFFAISPVSGVGQKGVCPPPVTSRKD